MKKKLTNYWSLIFVAIIVGFNLLLLWPETSIRMDLNDNVFAYALIVRMNEIFTQFLQHPSWPNFVLIFDHWVPQWAMGYPLPHFYQHIPHLVVVILYRLISLIAPISLMVTFNWTKYLMLCFFPLVIYYSARKFDLSRLAAAGSSLISTLIATNYLYGTDYNALVFRGSGMYTQLWGIFFLPLALSSIYYSLKYNKGYIKSVIFLSLTLAGHLVFGYMAVLSTPLLIFSLTINVCCNVRPDYKTYIITITKYVKRLFFILSATFILLSYWLIPLILDSNYQNKSVWDDFTKFNSYGWQQVLKWLVNGEIFDYGRLPVLTILVAMGFCYSLYLSLRGRSEATDEAIPTTCHPRAGGDPYKQVSSYRNNIDSRFHGNDKEKKVTRNDTKDTLAENPSFLFFPLLFIFWLILYFGRFTWGGLFDLLPMSEGLHGHRLVNGVHFAGIFLIGLSIEWLWILLFERSENYLRFLKNFSLRSKNILKITTLIFLIALILYPAFKERFDYLSWNNHLIDYYNTAYSQELPDFNKALQKIDELGKARINLGRPGNWGRNFTVGGFTAYFVASENGFDTIGFLPESWSLHSDIEQFFSENDVNYYKLFNIGYIIAPPEQKFDSFAVKIAQYGKFVLYKVPTEGNISFINSDILIHAKKTQKINLDRFWIGSKLMPLNEFPTVSFDNSYSDPSYKLTFTMTDWSNFKLGQPDNNNGDYNLFNTNPFDQLDKFVKLDQLSSTPSGQIISQTSASNYFSATVNTPTDSILLLRATYHPFWHAFIDGKEVNTFMVEPTMTAVRVPKGKHLVEFKYYAGLYKQILILITLLTIPALYLFLKRFKYLL